MLRSLLVPSSQWQPHSEAWSPYTHCLQQMTMQATTSTQLEYSGHVFGVPSTSYPVPRVDLAASQMIAAAPQQPGGIVTNCTGVTAGTEMSALAAAPPASVSFVDFQSQPSQPSATSTRTRRTVKAAAGLGAASTPVRTSARTRTPVSSFSTPAPSPARGLRRTPTKQQQRRQARTKAGAVVVPRTPSKSSKSATGSSRSSTRENSTLSPSPSVCDGDAPIKCKWGSIMYWGQCHRPASVFYAPATPDLHAAGDALVKERFFLLRTVDLLGKIALVLKDVMEVYEKFSTGGFAKEFPGCVKAQVYGVGHPLVCYVLPLSALGVHVTSLTQPGKNKFHRLSNAAARQWITRVHYIMTLPRGSSAADRAVRSTFDVRTKELRVGGGVVRSSPQQIARQLAIKAAQKQNSQTRKENHARRQTGQPTVRTRKTTPTKKNKKAVLEQPTQAMDTKDDDAPAATQPVATRSWNKPASDSSHPAGCDDQAGSLRTIDRTLAAAIAAANTAGSGVATAATAASGIVFPTSVFDVVHRAPLPFHTEPALQPVSADLLLTDCRGITTASPGENTVRVDTDDDDGETGADSPAHADGINAAPMLTRQLSLVPSPAPIPDLQGVAHVLTIDHEQFAQQFTSAMPAQLTSNITISTLPTPVVAPQVMMLHAVFSESGVHAAAAANDANGAYTRHRNGPFHAHLQDARPYHTTGHDFYPVRPQPYGRAMTFMDGDSMNTTVA